MTAPRPDSRARGRASARENRNQTSWETITDALEKAVGPGRPSGAWTRYCCPAHEGDGRAHRPSLGVKYDTNQHRTVVRCFAGCQNEDVLAKVGLGVRDMFDHLPERTARGYTPPRRARQISRADRAIDAAGLPLTAVKPGLGQQVSPWKQVAVYPYTHADGTVAGEVIRREAAFERGRDKKFAQRAWTANGWADTGFEPIPFQLPQLLAAIGAGRTVAICEGEKDAVNAAAAGLTATTNAGGAAAWRPEHAAWLRGASRVLIVVDRDAPGYRRADRVLATLSGLGIGRIRVVAAREGKDLSDHLAAGHRLADLEAVPFLDPSTPDARARGPGPRPPGLDPAGLPVAEALTALTSSPFADSLGGTDMAFFQDAPPVHDDTVDHYSAHFSRASQQFMQQLLWIIAQITERSRLEAERAKNDEAARRALEAARAAEQKAIEGRLSEMAKRGWNRASRSEIATALRDAAVWSGDSELARRAQVDLVGHIRNRFGITLDMDRGTATIDASGMSAQLARAEAERAVDNRIATAGDRMVTLVAADPGIEESAKRHLYGEIEAWRRNPSGRSLDDLTRQVTAAGGKDGLRARLRFTATYLATPEGLVPVDELGKTAPLSATAELRRTTAPLVDPAEEVKPRIDDMLVRYQDRLRHGMDTTSVTDQLTGAVNLLPQEEQDLARGRGRAIRDNPAAQYKRLWPNHVDRDRLDAVVRTYAGLAAQVEALALDGEDLPAEQAASREEMRARAHSLRGGIEEAITKGEGLIGLERDQLRAVLADIDAGKTTVPAQLFADDRSAAAADAERSDEIARASAAEHRRELDEILSSGAVPAGAARSAHVDIASVVDAHNQLAAGRVNLADYTDRGVNDRLTAKLDTAGVPEVVRDRLTDYLDSAVTDAARLGQQARRIQDRWTSRREMVSATRTPEPVAYDSESRRAGLATALRGAGLTEDEIAQRMAADAGHAHPPSAAAKRPVLEPRLTQSGDGMAHLQRRSKGRGGPDQGR